MDFDVLGVEACLDGNFAEALVRLHSAGVQVVFVEHVVGCVVETILIEKQTLWLVPVGRKRMDHISRYYYILLLFQPNLIPDGPSNHPNNNLAQG